MIRSGWVPAQTSWCQLFHARVQANPRAFFITDHYRGYPAMCVHLSTVRRPELKAVLEATQGNLSVHLRKLEDAGYVKIEKSFLARKPLTRVRLTAAGRKAFCEQPKVLPRV